MYTIGNAPTRLYDETPDKKAKLGDMLIAPDGRVYRYARAGAVAILGGSLVQASATETSSHILGKTVSNPTSGEGPTQGTRAWGITPTTTSFAANYFAEGYTGYIGSVGHLQQVSGHRALTAGAVGQIDLESPCPVVPSIGASRGFIYRNLYDGVIVTPASGVTKPVLGVTQREITANYYFWLLVSGLTACRRTGTLVEGHLCMPSTSTDGSVAPWSIAGTGQTAAISGDPEPGGVGVTFTLTPGVSHPVGQVVAFNAVWSLGALININFA